VTETTVQDTENVVTDKLSENVIKSEEKNAERIVSKVNNSPRNGTRVESSTNGMVEDSQVEGDSSHDEAYNSIIKNYYTTDPFFHGGADIKNLNAIQKERKLVASEKVRNGKLRHKIRVKSKKTNAMPSLVQNATPSLIQEIERNKKSKMMNAEILA
jgi:hypothetical protein